MPTFDPTLGIFVTKFAKEGLVPSRRASGSSITKVPSELRLHGERIDGRASSPTGATVNRTASSGTKKTPLKAGIRNQGLFKIRNTDPQLKIRPFRAKVTFKDETAKKETDNEVQSLFHLRLAPSPRMLSGHDLTLSEGNLVLAGIEEGPIETRLRLGSTGQADLPTQRLSPALAKRYQNHLFQRPGNVPDQHRKMSLDQSTNTPTSSEPKTVEDRPDIWLHHQSLPNIQEYGEDGAVITVISGSPTTKSASDKTRYFLRRLTSDKSGDRSKYLQKRQKQHKPDSMEKQESTDKETEDGGEHGSAEEKRRKFSIKERRFKKKTPPKPVIKNNKPQSSTESESAYQASQSVFIQICEEDEDKKKDRHSTSSSVASYTSAKDVFGRPSIDNSIPTIVVMPTTPTSSEINILDNQRKSKLKYPLSSSQQQQRMDEPLQLQSPRKSKEEKLLQQQPNQPVEHVQQLLYQAPVKKQDSSSSEGSTGVTLPNRPMASSSSLNNKPSSDPKARGKLLKRYSAEDENR